MKRPVLAPYSQTPIAIISFRTSAGETAFRDENPIIAGQKFAAHLAKRLGISREAEDQIAEAYGTIAAAHPRSMTKVFPRSLAFVERMKAIAQMPQELAELFSDGESAQIETRSAFKLLTKARADPSLRSEEHTSELQSLMRISYAVFLLNKH